MGNKGGDAVSEGMFTTAEIVDATVARWDGMRQEAGRRAGDERFRTWFFETMPAQAGARDDPGTHAFLAFEVACGLFDRGRTADAFLLLDWLGRHFVRRPEVDVAVRATMALTDTCVERAVDQETNAHAIRVLRAMIDSAREPGDPHLERALCRALSSVGHLSGRYTALDRAGTGELGELWRELAGRCRGSADPELRGWRAHALGNEALLWLQADREALARRGFAAITAEFGADPPGVSADVDLWVGRARHAVGVLDRFDVGEPELKLDFLRRQRYWDRRRRYTGLGFVRWLLAGAPRNHMRSLVRHARAKHRRSVGAVRSWLCAGEPFILLLRNFELAERSGISASTSLFPGPDEFSGDHVQVINFRDGSPVLSELAAAVPLVLVASTTAAELEMSRHFGQFSAPVRLYLPDETWFDTVSTLVSVADQVIVWAAELSSGLARELELLVTDRRTDDTLVVLESAWLDAVAQAYLPRAGGEPLTKDHPALAPFPHIVDAAELKDRHVAECPPLVRVVERLDAVRQAPIDQRLAELGARLAAAPTTRG